MTAAEWEAYGDACVSHDADAARELLLAVALHDASASHQTTTINGVDYRDLGIDAVNDGVEYTEQAETTQGPAPSTTFPMA